MRLLILFTCVISVASVHGLQRCQSVAGRAVRQFNGRKEDVRMPCKYHAVRQQCGDYAIFLTPGNRYMYPKYRLDSLWFKVANASDLGQYWRGRTDNKLARKYLAGVKDSLFNTKEIGKGYNFDVVMKSGRDGSELYAEAKNGDFKVTFTFWDPDSRGIVESDWIFECFRDGPQVGFPRQICGGRDKFETRNHAVNFLGVGKRDTEEAIYYSVFTDRALGDSQTNPLCKEATDIMLDNCTEESRKLAITTCKQILHSTNHVMCVTKYACDPMEIYVACLRWVCSGFQNDEACYKLASGIDMCRDFKSGNLTQRVVNADCYKDFIRADRDVPDQI